MTKNKQLILSIFLLPLLGLVGCTSIQSFLQPKEKSLHELALSNDTAKIRKIFGFDIDANVRDATGKTPLHLAASKNHFDLAGLLLARSADVTSEDSDGNTALHLAIENNANETITILLRYNASLLQKNKQGINPLELAYKTNKKLLPLLLDTASVKQVDATGSSILHWAASKSYADLVELSLAAGAVPSVKNNDKRNPLDLVLAQEANLTNARIAKALLSAGSSPALDVQFDYLSALWPSPAKNPVFSQNQSALHLAVLRKHPGILALLLEDSFNPNVFDNAGNSPLLLAAEGGSTDMVGLLLAAKADVNARDQNDNTPLHRALNSAQALDVIRVLLNAQALPNNVNKEGNSPLHIIVNKKLAGQLIGSLTKAGANTSVKDAEGNTALILAIKQANAEHISQLLTANASIYEKNKKGESSLSLALQGERKLYEWLLTPQVRQSVDTEGSSINHHIVNLGDYPSAISYTLSQGLAIGTQDKKGQSVLHLASRLERTETVKLLLSQGADVYQSDATGQTSVDILLGKPLNFFESVISTEFTALRDKSGQTPLFYAARNGRVDLFKSLIEKGSDLQLRNNAGAGILHQAVRHGQLGIVQEALKLGANVETVDSLGNTALHYMVQWSQLALADSLLKARSPLEAANAGGRTALQEAVRSGDYAMVVYLVNAKANPGTTDKDGRSLLFDAVGLKDSKIASLILDQGRPVNQRDKQGNTALHEAAMLGNKTMNDLLIQWGGDIFAENAKGETPIHRALASGLAATSALVTKSNHNSINNIGNSIMHLAATLDTNQAVISYLLSLSPDLLIRNKLGKTALDLAREAKRETLQKELEAAMTGKRIN